MEWIHEFRDEPVAIYSELDSGNRELRKVEMLRSGAYDYADAHMRRGKAALSLEPLPTDEEIISDPQFRLLEITAAEFETVWALAVAQNH